MYRIDVRRGFISFWSKSAIVFGLGFLALLAPAAQAQGPLNYFQNYFVTGDYVVGGVGLYGSNPNPTATINFSGVPCTSGPGLVASVVPCSAKGAYPADIVAAFLYWETIEPTTSTTPTATAGTFDANLTSGPNINPSATVPMSGLALGSPQVPACVAGGGTETKNTYMRVYRADVLRYLAINSTANVRTANYTHTITFTGNPAGTQFYGATLVVVYRLVTPGTPRIAPLRSVVIYDGAFTGVASRSPSLNQTIGGFYEASTSPNAKMTQIVGGGQKGFAETLTVNGGIPQGVPSNPLVGALGPDWDSYTFNYNLASKASSVQTEVQSSNDCLSWGAIITSTNVLDSDFDGLLDIWETSGLYLNPGVRNDGTTTAPTPATFGTCPAPAGSTIPCVNFPAMGAKPSVPDIFIQIDWMQSTGLSVPDHIHSPQLAALNMVGSTFQSHGINMHFDVGKSSTYQTSPASPYIIPAAYAQGGNVVEESSVLCFPSSTVTCGFPNQSSEYSVLGWKTGFSAIKDGDSGFPLGALPQLFAQNRKDSFHYALFAHAIAATTALSAPNAGSISGVADLPGGDLMVTLGLWRTGPATPPTDQVGTTLEQAGTLMHELGHNLGLGHGGWYGTPVCKPDYPSVMNYLYQVQGLTDAAGNEHLDYSYGLLLPLDEDALSVKIPMGIQSYRVRYFGPFNSIAGSPQANTPGQASAVYCTGDIPTGSEGKYVRLEGPTVATPDWSNGTVTLGKTIPPLDINYDATLSQLYTDSPDWYSLNLQQVSARANVDGASLDLGKSDIGKSDIGKSDIGTSDLGKSDIGTAALGQDALGDQDYATFALSGVTPPTTLTVSVNVPSTPPNPQYPGGNGNLLGWTAPTTVQVASYNVYRCNASAVAGCTPVAPPLATVVAGTTYTDTVNDQVDAPTSANCNTKTCYNTNYTYFVTAVVVVGTLSTESGPSNAVTSEVNHLFVMGNAQTAQYGATTLPFPAPTYSVYGNVSGSLTSGVSCIYSPSTPRNAGNYTITCSGPATSGGTDGVTYNLAYLTYTPGSLTITQRPITVTAATSTKVYDGTTNAQSTPPATPTITTGSLAPSAYGDTLGFTETYDTKNVATNHVMTPAGIVNDTNGGGNYLVTFVKSAASSVITPASLAITATTNTKTYDGTASAAAIPTTSVVCGVNTVSGPPTLCGTDTITGLTETYNNQNAGTGKTLSVAATYTVNDGFGGADYTVTLNPNTTGVIIPAPVTATAGSYSGTYNAAAQSPSACSVTPIAPNAFIGTLTCTNNPASVGPNAGSGTVSPVPAVGGTDSLGNYAITSVNGSWTILKANPTITVTPYNVTYNGNPQTATGTATGVAAVTLAGLNLSSTTHTNAGTYATDPWTFTDVTGNYNNASGTVSDSIAKANANITVTPYNVTYNGSPYTAAGTATGVNATNLTSELNVSGTTHTNAGTYGTDPWTFVDTTGNYNNASGTVSDSIAQATPTVTDSGPTPTTPDYGQPETLTVTVAPPSSGEMPTGTVTFSFTLNTVTNYICSNGTITTSTPPCTVPLTLSNGNYIASVTPSLPTGAENVLATYSGDPNFLSEPANNLSVTVSQASSGVSLTKSTDPTTYGTPVNLTVNVVDATGGSIGVPTGTVTLSFQLDPTVQNGQVYYICADGTVTTTPCANPVTLAPDPNNPIGATATVPTSALPAGLATFANPGATPPTPFSYPINATYSGDTNFAAGAPFGLSQTVNQLPVTATAGSYTGTYNGATQSPSACVVTPISPSTSTGTLTCTNNPTTVGPNVGSGSVTPVPAVGANDSLNNYAITSVNGSWNINQAPVTVNLLNMAQTYTAGPLTPTVSTMPSNIAVSLTGGGDVNAGGYPVSAVVTNPNYTGSASGTFVINQYPVTVTATGVNKDFDGTTNATVTLSDNRIPGDNSINDSYTSASFVSSGAGAGITVNVNGIGISGPGTGNYALLNTTATTTATISDTINLPTLSLNGKNFSSNAAAPPVWTGSALQLTSGNDQTASAWLGTVIPVSSAFTTTFQFQITPRSTSATSIGDGFAFVIQGAPAGAATLGTTGLGMYMGYAGIPNSIAIEFDTYQNTGYEDPSSPHIGIQSLGTAANSPDHTPATGARLVTPVTATFADGNQHTATITYDGTSTISVYLDGSATPLVSGTVTGGLNTFLGLSGGNAYVGFTAATGGAQEDSDILSWTWN